MHRLQGRVDKPEKLAGYSAVRKDPPWNEKEESDLETRRCTTESGFRNKGIFQNEINEAMRTSYALSLSQYISFAIVTFRECLYCLFSSLAVGYSIYQRLYMMKDRLSVEAALL